MGFIKDLLFAKKRMSDEDFDHLRQFVNGKCDLTNSMWSHLHEASQVCTVLMDSDPANGCWKTKRKALSHLLLTLHLYPCSFLNHKITTKDDCILYYKNFKAAYNSLPEKNTEFKNALKEALPPFEECFRDEQVDGRVIFEYEWEYGKMVFVLEYGAILKQCKKLLEEEITIQFPEKWYNFY